MCTNYVGYVKSIFIFSGSLVVYSQCVGVYVVSVSIFAGCGCVYIVHICVYAKCLYVYIPSCSCINWVTSAKLCVFLYARRIAICVHAVCVDI